MYNIKNGIGAIANGKAVTLMAKGSVEELVLLGSSCPASVSLDDGGVQSFVILPETENEVIAVAIDSGSRISPIIMTSGSCLKTGRRAR